MRISLGRSPRLSFLMGKEKGLAPTLEKPEGGLLIMGANRPTTPALKSMEAILASGLGCQGRAKRADPRRPLRGRP